MWNVGQAILPVSLCNEQEGLDVGMWDVRQAILPVSLCFRSHITHLKLDQMRKRT